jgi:exodeoxyribonuclease VII large subunit
MFDFGPPRRAEPAPAREPDAAVPTATATSTATSTSTSTSTSTTTSTSTATVLQTTAAAPREEPKVYSVSELVRGAARALEVRFGLVWVEGEVSNLSQPRSGHLYFTLKDVEAQLPSVMFQREAGRLKFRLEPGLKVRARGRLSIFDAQGKFQLYVEGLEPTGLGAQQLAFEQLKRKLAAEGLFDPARKRPLPRWPRRIGLATSPTGAAVRDVLRIAHRRGRVSILLAGCQVQGDGAPREIIAALRALERQPNIDVIIVGRGGGSAEDLQAFNDEALARAIAACRVPVVSAVGHEVDFTIADFVADLRAPTPSAAAELVVPLHAEAEARLDETQARLLRAGRRAIGDGRQRLDGALDRAAAAIRQSLARRRRVLDEGSRRLAALHPRARLQSDRAALQALDGKLRARVALEIDRRRRSFATLAGKLDALSPLGVLERGYSLARDANGHVLTRASAAQPGDPIRVTLARGELGCRVEVVETDEEDA